MTQLAFLPPDTETKVSRDRCLGMWRMFGRRPDKTCGECSHLLRIEYHLKTYFKCELYGVSMSASTDWRKKWAACGKFSQLVPPL